ncbi:MAG: hypothetical protein K2J25_02695 [Oscillospiraceae bacterium]|nr:hypothetical protein [Oscillospiraceae bacterium]
MNYELFFIKNFIIKSRQDRLLYELQNLKKRQDCLGRFCHYAENLLDMQKICHTQDFEKILGNPECYIMAYHQELDKLTCNLKQALKLVLGNGMSAVIIGKNFAIVETEQLQGTPDRYFLKLF